MSHSTISGVTIGYFTNVGSPLIGNKFVSPSISGLTKSRDSVSAKRLVIQSVVITVIYAIYRFSKFTTAKKYIEH